MLIVSFVLTFFLTFYLFAVSSALTYLSMRSWLYHASLQEPRAVAAARPFGGHRRSTRYWNQPHWAHALRSIGFALVMVAALTGAVDAASGIGVGLARVAGYAMLLFTTPRRLRRQPVVMLAIVLLALGEAIVLLNSRLPSTIARTSPLGILSIISMDVGMALLWRVYTRTLMRVRLTDKYTLAFAVFSVFLMIVISAALAMVIQGTIHDIIGMDERTVLLVYQSMIQPMTVIFVGIVATSGIISFFVARSLIAPVNRMAVALRAIGRGELDYRLHGIRSRDEMRDLAVELNEMARRLQEADALRAEFVSFASHELRNPLTAVKGFIDTLAMLDGPDGESISQDERVEIYQIIRSECDRLLRMTNELLDTSRVEAGMPVVLNTVQFDVKRRVQKVVDIMRGHTEKHQLGVIGPDQPVMIEADPDKIEQILINLLSNAIKYAPSGGPIDVTVEDRDTSVEISVKDRGVGMTDEQAERVFDKFYRIQYDPGSTPAANAVGTGIGLYLTRALVNAHGGTIRVKSVLDEGSNFIVTLPKKPVPPPEPDTDVDEISRRRNRRMIPEIDLVESVRNIASRLEGNHKPESDIGGDAG